MNQKFAHIRKLSDVKELKLTINPSVSSSEFQFICPITLMEFNGLNQFIVVWTTGHVLSEKALREMGINSLQTEYGPFQEEHVLRLLPSEEEIAFRLAKLETARELARKSKEQKKRSRPTDAAPTEGQEAADNGDHHGHQAKQQALHVKLSDQVVSTASESVKKMESSSNVYKKLFHKKAEEKSDKDLFITVGGLRYTLN